MLKTLTPLILAASLVSAGTATAQTTRTPAPSTAPADRGGGLGDSLGGLGGDLGGLGGGLGGLLGGAMPSVGSIGAGNAAGLLGYCLKNNLLGQGGLQGGGQGLGGMLGGLTGQSAATPRTAAPATGAQSILQRLTGRRDVQTSPGYAAGQAGKVQAGNGQSLSLGNLGGQVKTKLCSLVLNRAKAFL
ncbi:DUF2501 domain-containing protein [Sphingomonas sp. UV9]|uniref:DUF2501 domain-containing protein n=1 Tax=Sphingomonas sp. UV9 TaxID=1851410 RepID=UPI000FFB22EE|nr:DUF2501 domain-containing protein [Sphingomonas sp. UV9]RXD05188.1 DUF2501 domain-containing protein [Sphingomonas sp. UV9]